jgi:hypothetical protein
MSLEVPPSRRGTGRVACVGRATQSLEAPVARPQMRTLFFFRTLRQMAIPRVVSCHEQISLAQGTLSSLLRFVFV